jgi:hypothetical protein
MMRVARARARVLLTDAVTLSCVFDVIKLLFVTFATPSLSLLKVF